jgi:hypothetical protein
MARMSREFNLVLLGAGLLSAGFFLLPEDDPVNLAAREAESGGGPAGAGGGGRGSRVRTGHVIIFYGAPGATSRPFASTARASTVTTTRGGFGRTGAVSVGS